MAQNSFVLDAMEREAIKAPADAHPQNSLPGKSIALKLLKPSLKTLLGITLSYLEADFCELKFSTLENFLSSWSASITKLLPSTPVNLITFAPAMRSITD